MARAKGWKKDGFGYSREIDGLFYHVRRLPSTVTAWELTLIRKSEDQPWFGAPSERVAICSNLTHAAVCATSHARKLAAEKDREWLKAQLRVINGGLIEEE